MSEPRAVATGSQNQAELQDPIATAPGSDTVSESLGYYQSSPTRTMPRALFLRKATLPKLVGILPNWGIASVEYPSLRRLSERVPEARNVYRQVALLDFTLFLIERNA